MKKTAAAFALSLTGLLGLAEVARATPPTEIVLVPGERASFGAWLVVGPFASDPVASRKRTKPASRSKLAPRPSNDERLALTLAGHVAGRTTVLASSGSGPIDLEAALGKGVRDAYAYAYGVIRVTTPGTYYALLGTDDGVRLSLDGKTQFERDEPRPYREDDDAVRLELGVGDHALLLRLHQRDGAWLFRVRLTDGAMAAPRGAKLVLPGCDPAKEGPSLATSLARVSVERRIGFDGYFPSLVTRFDEGAPQGVPLVVRGVIRGLVAPLAAPETSVPVGDVVTPHRVFFPTIRDEDLGARESLSVDVDAAGRTLHLPFPVLAGTRRAVRHGHAAIASLRSEDRGTADEDARATVSFLTERLESLVFHGDADDAQRTEATELDRLAGMLERREDPFAKAPSGPSRFALRSKFDGALSEYALYVPERFAKDTDRTSHGPYPLVVALHGMYGKPMQMLRWIFGGDDPKHDGAWEDRHPLAAWPTSEAFILAPSGRGDTMYRDLGELDVVEAIDAVKRHFPIDGARISITGPSMGGIGAAAIPLHFPGVFAAAAPLCGYHSLFVRRDVAGRAMRPWERVLAEERSAVFWAENGRDLPLYIVHGTRDLPEENSGVLIKRYDELGFSVKHEHPALGHNVWQPTYEGGKGLSWLLSRRTSKPRRSYLRTDRLRFARSGFFRVTRLGKALAWASVDAERSDGKIAATTKNVTGLSFDREGDGSSIRVTVDGTTLDFAAQEPLDLSKVDAVWIKGPPAKEDRPRKRSGLAGAFRDVFLEPLVFVYGASDPNEARVNETVARSFARVAGNVDAHYPVLSDAEYLALSTKFGPDHSLFLVGRPTTNRVTALLDPGLPIHVDADGTTVGGRRVGGRDSGAAFVYPHPQKPGQYVAVVEGTSLLGTLHAQALPQLAPDFMVFDAGMAAARGQILLGASHVLAGGFFTDDWSVPATVEDPLARSEKTLPRNEYEATPYLP